MKGALSQEQEQPSPAPTDIISRSLAKKVILATVIAAMSYGVLLFRADARTFATNLATLTARVLLYATLWSVANFAIRAVRWEYYLRRLGVRVPLRESLLIFFAGFAMSITPAKSGEVLKSLMLRASSDVPVARTAPVVVAERLTDVIGLVLLAGLGLSSVTGSIWGALLAVLATLALIVLTGSRRLGAFTIDFLTRFRRTARLRGKLHEAHAALLALMTPFAFLVGTSLSLAAWATHGLVLSAITRSFPGSSITVAGSMLAYCSPLLAGTLAMIPGGLGLTEASMTGVLVHTGGPGITLAVATAISIVVRFLTFWLAIVLGFVALGLWQLKQRAARASSTTRST
jgi:uncharacterized protein (TIRG00374 family)